MGGQLSGGEQQMPTTAPAILDKPRLLLDQPLEGLAPVICDELMAAFAQLVASGRTTALLIEQHLKAALDFAEHVVILERGKVVWTGAPATLEADPETVSRLPGVRH